MFSALTATLGQLTDPRLRNPILLSITGSLAAILLLTGAVAVPGVTRIVPRLGRISRATRASTELLPAPE